MKKMKIISIHFVIIGCMVFNATFAYSQEILTWEECVRRGKERHPDLVSAAEKVKQAKADKDIELSSILPQVDADASGKRTQTASKSTSGGYTKKYSNTYTYGITGTQLLFDGFKTSSEVSSAMKTIQAEQYKHAVVSSNVRLDLRNAFIELLKAQEFISLTREIAKRRTQNLELVKLRYEAGREHKGSLLTAEADLARAEFDVAEAERSISLAQRKLSKELGYDKLKGMQAGGEFAVQKDYNENSNFEDIADSTPFLKELIAKKEAARYNLQSEQADFLPKVYLNASADKTNSDWPPRHDGWSAGLSVSLPLFEGGSRIAEAAKAKSQLRQAEADQRSGRDSVLVTLEGAWKELQDSIAYVSVQEKFLEAAQERARITKAQYETGLMSFDDWIIIEDNLVSVRKAYLNAQADMLTAEAYWIQAIGGTLEYDENQI